MRRPVALPGDRLSPLATAGLDRWPFKTELGLQTPLTAYLEKNALGSAAHAAFSAPFLRKWGENL